MPMTLPPGGHRLREAAGIGTEADRDNASAGCNVKGRGNADGLRVGTVEVVDLDGIGIALVVGDGGDGVAIKGEPNDDCVTRGGEIGKLEVVAEGT
jgi:hypothetical protein